jgi:hypothetical protein
LDDGVKEEVIVEVEGRAGTGGLFEAKLERESETVGKDFFLGVVEREAERTLVTATNSLSPQ